MAKRQQLRDDLSTIVYPLQNLLAIELWRGGLSQTEIGKRLGVATATVNKMLKGVSRTVSAAVATEK